MERSEDLSKLGLALSKAQAKIAIALRESENPFFHSHYADLTAIWEACRGPLGENELSVIQVIESDGTRRWLKSMLLHSSGQFVTSELDLITLNLDKDGKPRAEGMQALGSAITYARRYTLAALVGVVAEEDDDGEAAEGHSVAVSRDHFCKEHGVAFVAFTKGNETWFSHKIKGTDQWCNEGKTKQRDVPIVKEQYKHEPETPPVAVSQTQEPEPKKEQKKEAPKTETPKKETPKEENFDDLFGTTPKPTVKSTATRPDDKGNTVKSPTHTTTNKENPTVTPVNPDVWERTVTDIGKLYTAAYEVFGLTPAEVHKIPNVSGRSDIVEPQKEWQTICDYMKANPDKNKRKK